MPDREAMHVTQCDDDYDDTAVQRSGGDDGVMTAGAENEGEGRGTMSDGRLHILGLHLSKHNRSSDAEQHHAHRYLHVDAVVAVPVLPV
ncbi:hypothetical protein CVT25_004913 [Psilocybe cyanescens]|uniref:Uncharacterized protein n=1 Tax=Psilocybe cyanescens TaxID=93625 RepID=A0A409W3Z7_PSICY|nr:hypothetical protein CVT25_004913 [Psilocybe cyanescens]